MFTRPVSCIGRIANNCKSSVLTSKVDQFVIHQQVRTTIKKHFDPKFRRLRSAKVIKVDLPDFQEKRDEDITPEKYLSQLKKMGLQPHKFWNERVFYVSNTGAVLEPYVPPEGDGKLSAVSVGGAKQKLEFLEKKGKSMMAIRKIKSFDEDFNLQDFVDEAYDIYKSAHEALMNFRTDKLKIEEFVTEKAYLEMCQNAKYKTIYWKLHQSLSPPRVVHSRTTHMITKENIFAQITVRLHTQQSLCIYDRFGQLEYGDKNLTKDVLEYIVFEKHVSDQYGKWRLHHKIIPEWMPVSEPVKRTFHKPDPLPDLPEVSSTQQADESAETNTTSSSSPALA